MMDYDDPKLFIKMSLEDIQTPKPGRLVYGPRWWGVTEDNCVLFYKSYASPQCNQHKAIVERIYPRLKPVYLPLAYVPHNCGDYI